MTNGLNWEGIILQVNAYSSSIAFYLPSALRSLGRVVYKMYLLYP